MTRGRRVTPFYVLVGADTRVDLASNAKQFTAAVILSLALERRLALETGPAHAHQRPPQRVRPTEGLKGLDHLLPDFTALENVVFPSLPKRSGERRTEVKPREEAVPKMGS